MNDPVIFCPQCQALIWDALSCGTCGWRRSYADLGVGVEAWRTRIPAKIERSSSQMVVINGTLVCADIHGGLWAMRVARHGALLWEQPHIVLQNSTIGGLAEWGGKVLATYSEASGMPTSNRPMRGVLLDMTTKAEAWAFDVSARRLSAPTVAGDRLFFSAAMNEGAWAYARDLHAQRLLWRAPIERWSDHPPLVSNGFVWYGQGAKVLQGFALAGPDAGDRRHAVGSITCSMVAGEQQDIFLVIDEGRILARLDTRSGQIQYYDSDVHSYTSPPCIKNGKVVVGVLGCNKEPLLHEYDITAHKLELKYELSLKRQLTQPPVIMQKTVVALDEAGSLWMFPLHDRRHTELVHVDTPLRPCTPPVVNRDLVFLAGRDGEIEARYWCQPMDMPYPAETYAQRRSWEAAGTAYALQKHWLQAARSFEQDELWQKAHAMYQQAQDWDGMARMSEASGDFGNAAKEWRRVGHLECAAEALERLGDWEEAGALWQRLEHFGAAATAYRNAKRFDRMFAVLEKLKDEVAKAAFLERLPADEQKALWHHDRGEYEAAAAIWEQLGARGQAAHECALAGNVIRALHLYKQEGDWRSLLDVAQPIEAELSAGGTEMLALALEALAQTEDGFEKASRVFARAAEAYSSLYNSDLDDTKERHLADLYEHAARCAEQAFDSEVAPEYRRRVARYRHLPRLDIRLLPGASEIVAGEHNRIKMEIHNIGYGTAKNIELTLSGAMETTGIVPIPRLKPAQMEIRDVNVYFPETHEQRRNVGQLLVKLELAYRLPDGNSQASTHTMTVNVKARPDGNTTTIWHVAGSVNQAQEIIQGDQYRAGSQHGDRVNIVRNAQDSGRQLTTTCDSYPTQCPDPTCGFDLSGSHDYEYCPACGKRLFP